MDTQRIRLTFAYDGGAYHGWAKQPGLPTVQQALEEAIAQIIREPIATIVAGRTDAGVHALGQVVHADIPIQRWQAVPRNAPLAPAAAFLRRINGVLARNHPGIVVHQVAEVSADFDARFAAIWRQYRYRIADETTPFNPLLRHMVWRYRGELDVAVMHREAQTLLGLHDFLSFCRPRPHSTTIRRLIEFNFSRTPEGVIEAMVRADAFCHNMVRALIAASTQVGVGRQAEGWLAQRLAEARRDSSISLAPAAGLVLEEVGYAPEAQWAQQVTATRAKREH